MARPPHHSKHRDSVVLIRRILAGMGDHNTAVNAGGVAFFGLFAIVPTLIAAVSIYGLVADPDEAERQITELTENVPEATGAFLTQMMGNIQTGNAALVASLISIGVALFAASAALKHLISTINHIYEFPADRNFFKSRGLAIVLLLGAIIFFALATFVIGIYPVILNRLGLSDALEWILRLAPLPVFFVVMITALSVLYRVAPTRTPSHGRWFTWGSVVATVIFGGGTLLLRWFASSQFQTWGATYGVFLGIIVTMFWLLIAANAVLIGAEVNAARGGGQVWTEDSYGRPTTVIESKEETTDIIERINKRNGIVEQAAVTRTTEVNGKRVGRVRQRLRR